MATLQTIDQLVRLGRILTLLLVAIAAVWVPAIGDFPDLFAYLQEGFTYAATPLVFTIAAIHLLQIVQPQRAASGLVVILTGLLVCFFR